MNTVIINGAECEPYITGDHRTMLERPEEIIGGAKFLAKMFGVDKVVIGVEDNKRNGIDAMNKVIAEQKAPVVVEPLRCRYPQGGEKQLCQAITGRQVPPGGLPADIGCAVFNINTTCAIYRALTTGMPVVRKIVTASGSQGSIEMMVGVDAEGAVTGVSVVNHSETSGIGTKVVGNEPTASGVGVLDQFIGKSAADGTLTVGTNVDAITGATVSTKGVTAGVNAALAAVAAMG